MLKDMFKRKELICVSCQKKIQYEEELVAFVKLPKERSILVGPFDVCFAKQHKKYIVNRVTTKSMTQSN